MIRHWLPVAILSAVCLSLAQAEEPDAFQLVDGEFPPHGTARYAGGELTGVDHVNRTGVLRPDRSDLEPKAFQDLPYPFEMLPYGQIFFNGAPAELRDIPVGTHLHGYFYLEGEDVNPKAPGYPRRPEKGYFSRFSRAFMLEDDFSHYQRRGIGWQITEIDREANTLTAIRVPVEAVAPTGDVLESPEAVESEEPRIFDLHASTRVWAGDRIGTLEDVREGQTILFNLTWATLYGPGYLTDIWVDAQSRSIAMEQQRQRHQFHQWHRGLPAIVDHVEHGEHGEGGFGLVTVTLFAGLDPELYEALHEKTSTAGIAVEPSLRGYDQNNDRKGGKIHEVTRSENPPLGSSGIQVKFETQELIEGFRPGRHVRLLPSGWFQNALPREEKLWPRDVRDL